MLRHQQRQSIIDLRPNLARHHRLERRRWDLQRQVAPPNVAAIDDGAARRVRAGQEPSNFLDRLLRGRQTYPGQCAPGQGLQALQRQRQMRAALVAGDGVNFIDDHGTAGREHVAAGLRAQQDVQGFRCGHHDVRRPTPHAGAFRLRRVAGAHHRTNLDVGQTQGHQLFANAVQRRLEIALDVVRQCLQGRNVHHARLVRQRRFESLLHQLIDGRQKRRKGLAGPRRSGHQDMFARGQRRPGADLRLCGRIKGPRKPGRNCGVKGVEYAHSFSRGGPGHFTRKGCIDRRMYTGHAFGST